MDFPTSALVVMTLLFSTALSEEISLTCADTARRKLKDISKIFNCIPSLIPEEEVAICHGDISEVGKLGFNYIFVNWTFKVLEEIPEGRAICLGLLNYSYEVMDRLRVHSSPLLLRYGFDFNPLLAVGTLTTDHNTSKNNRSYSISLLSDVLNLPILRQFEPWDENFWNFSSSLLGTPLNWIQSFSLYGGDNEINLMSLENLQNTNIQSIDMTHITVGTVALVRGMPVLGKMIFDFVRLYGFNPDSFVGMSEMEILSLKGTKLSGIPEMIDLMPKLKILEIEDGAYDLTSDFIIPTKKLTALKNLEVLNLRFNYIPSISGKLPPFQKLRILNLDFCRLFNIEKDDFMGYPMLEELTLSGNKLTYIEEDTFLPLRKLKFLDLSQNKLTNWPVLYDCSLSFLNVSRNLLPYVYNLGNTGSTVEVLNISFNRISEWKDKYMFSLQESVVSYADQRRSHSENSNQKKMTKTNPFLRILGLSLSPSLSGLQTELIHVNQSLVNLTELLPNTKSSEKITANEFDDGHEYSNLMQSHVWVKKIDISNNWISGLTEKMTQSLNGIREVDLGGNEFNCVDCRMIPFQKWLNTTSTIVKNVGTSDPFLCSSPVRLRRTPVNLVQFDEEPCLEKIRTTSLLILIGGPVGVMSMLAVAAAGGIYKYRSQIVYMLHLYKIRQRAKAFSRYASNKYAFDAFICYSSQDRRFVLTRLAPLLEKGKEQYCVCLHDRDFPLGSHIVPNIVASIQHSRKTIVVLSEYFIRSTWCNWELEMANHKMFTEDEHFLILIQLEDMDRNKLPRHLQFLMDTRTYLEWHNGEQQLVVQRLKKALGPSIYQTTNERAPLLADVMEE